MGEKTRSYRSFFHLIINDFEIYIGTLIFILMTLLLTVQVVSRYVFNYSITWTEELSVIFFVWLIYLGVAGAVTKRKNLKIDAFINVLPFRWKKAILIVDNLIMLVFCGGVVFPLIKLIENQTRSRAVTSLLRLPKNIIYAIIPFCMLLTCIRLLQDTYKLMHEGEEKLGMSKPTIDIEALEKEAASGLANLDEKDVK